jgi:hypothetical protein
VNKKASVVIEMVFKHSDETKIWLARKFAVSFTPEFTASHFSSNMMRQ